MHNSPHESNRQFSSRFKFGLETPLEGRYVGEDKKLVFAPPQWYDKLVGSCLVLGFLSVLSSPFGFGGGFFFDGTSRFWVGLSVALAGLWALLSNERLICDLGSRQYSRWEGKGPFKHVSRGSLDELDAIVLIASQQATPTLNGVIYRLVLHWKGSRLPLLVVGQWSVSLSPGSPLNSGAGPVVALGSRFAKSLRVPFFDNSYFHSPGPVKPV